MGKTTFTTALGPSAEGFYAGADITAYVAIREDYSDDKCPRPLLSPLAELQTLSYSIFRENNDVRSLGGVNVRGITAGPRTIAGSMIFSVFNQRVMKQLLMRGRKDSSAILENPADLEYVLLDQLPPFDILVKYANEYGNRSYMILFAVRCFTEGQVHSIHDAMTETTVQFKARGILPMTTPSHNTSDGEVLKAGYALARAMKGGAVLYDDLTSGMLSPSTKRILKIAGNPFKPITISDYHKLPTDVP